MSSFVQAIPQLRNRGFSLGKVPAARCVRVAFILLDQFSMSAFSNALDALAGIANAGQAEYQISTWSMAGGAVRSDVGLAFDTHGIVPGRWHHEVLVVVGGHRVKLVPDATLNRVLRSAAADRVVLCGLWNGAFHLAQAGALRGQEAACHPDSRAAVSEYHPTLVLRGSGHAFSQRVGTCADASAALGLMLDVLKLYANPGAAAAEAEVRRVHQPAPQVFAPAAPRRLPGQLDVALTMMEENIEEPLEIEQIADRIGVSRRQLERRFVRYLKAPPVRYYLELRLARARQLIVHSDRSLTDVALATGFVSYPHFYRRFKERFGLPPMEFRITYDPLQASAPAFQAVAMN